MAIAESTRASFNFLVERGCRHFNLDLDDRFPTDGRLAWLKVDFVSSLGDIVFK
jgi:hypothetical protein